MDEVRDRVTKAIKASCEDALAIDESLRLCATAAEYRQAFTAFHCAMETGGGGGTMEVLSSAIERAREAARLPEVVEEEDTTVGTSAVACRCGSRNVTDRTVQARSADEAPDVFYVCKTCGRTWRN